MQEINATNTYAVALKAGQPVVVVGGLAFPVGYAPNLDKIVLSVNGIEPDTDGNVSISTNSIGAFSSTGGVLTGKITLGGAYTDFVCQNTDDSYISILGGQTWKTGAVLYLFGNSHTEKPGHIQLTARNDSTTTNLIITPGGDMTFSGRDVTVGHPDYSTSIAVSGTTYTAPVRGWLYVGAVQGLTINETTLNPTGTMFIPLQKGDVVSATAKLNATFYPARG